MSVLVWLSLHAKEQARERGVTIAEIKQAIQMGAKHTQDDKIVADYGYIRVVYRMVGSAPYVITVMIR